MYKFESIDELKRFLTDELLLTNEATEYLDISSQRLNQLVHSGKLNPIKSNRSSSIFLKSELYERKFELEKTSNNKQYLYSTSDEVINDACCYFAGLSLFKNSFKQWDSIYDHLSETVNLESDLTLVIEEICAITGFDKNELIREYTKVKNSFKLLKENDLIIKIGSDLYPQNLANTEQAPRFLFLRGNVNLLKFSAISIVGTRNPTEVGIKRAKTLAEKLGQHRIVVASGLAKGIDTAAHIGAISNANPTIAVIGTPLNIYYPKENQKLQDEIASKGLLVSQFAPSMNVQRWNFPMRNAVMSGLSLATVIIEAGETSGSLIQADYALKQERIVMIPQSAIENDNLKWPKKYITRKGAFKFSTINELIKTIGENLKNPLFEEQEKEEQDEHKLPLREGSIEYVPINKKD